MFHLHIPEPSPGSGLSRGSVDLCGVGGEWIIKQLNEWVSEWTCWWEQSTGYPERSTFLLKAQGLHKASSLCHSRPQFHLLELLDVGTVRSPALLGHSPFTGNFIPAWVTPVPHWLGWAWAQPTLGQNQWAPDVYRDVGKGMVILSSWYTTRKSSLG